MKQIFVLLLALSCSLLSAELNDDLLRQSCPFGSGAVFCNAAFNNLCVSGSVNVGGDLDVNGGTI